MTVVIEIEELFIKRRVISKYASRIIVDMNTTSGCFNNDARVGVGNNPMKFGRREFGAKWSVNEIHFRNERFNFFDV